MNSRNLIPIRTHAHPINTCSSKFGATLGLKMSLKQKCHLYYVIIIIIHYKHWLYDSTTPIWLYTPGINVLFFFVFSRHTAVTSDLPSSRKCPFYFYTRMWHPERISIGKCHKNTITRWCVEQQRRYCRARIHKITKDYYLFFFLTLQSLFCRFKNNN